MQYVKIKDIIIEQIAAGLLAPRQKLPSERQLAESFNTTRVTLREALSLLESEGAIYREDRRGWFISPPALRYDIASENEFQELATQQGRQAEMRFIRSTRKMADKHIAQIGKLPPFTDVQCIERIGYLESRPVAFVMSYLHHPNTLNWKGVSATQSLTQQLAEQFFVTCKVSKYQVKIGALSGECAQHLYATGGTPAVVVTRQYHDDQQQFVRVDMEYWRHDAVIIEGISPR